MSGLRVLKPGVLSLVQDGGRYGYHHLGLATGGPMDVSAFRWGNRLCGNPMDAAAIEVSIGGLTLEVQVTTRIAVTGAELPLQINGQLRSLWKTHRVVQGDIIELGFAARGLRAYVCVSGGIQAQPVFDSVATVVRESVGGLQGNGKGLRKGDLLPCPTDPGNKLFRVPERARPLIAQHIRLRVICGYQEGLFSDGQKRKFFEGHYHVSDSSDRMGYRLEGPPIRTQQATLLSEGICLGAIQIPPDGHPIILLRDRQTIGGYPKLGSVLSLDLGPLSQMKPGAQVRFEKIDIHAAQNLLRETDLNFRRTPLEQLGIG